MPSQPMELITKEQLDYQLEEQFVQAIETTLIEMIDDDSFREAYRNLKLIFPIPECTKTIAGKDLTLLTDYSTLYPKSFPFTRTVINLCYERTFSPWTELHQIVGNFIVKKLNERYRLKLIPNYQVMNTTDSGFFETLRDAVDNGSCDVCVSSVNINADRLKQVQYFCGYGTSSSGFLRGPKNPTLSITNIKDLNQTGVIVLVYSSFYGNIGKRYAPAATFKTITSGYDEIYAMLLRQEAHAVVADVSDLQKWLNDNKEKCGSNCLVRGFDTPFDYGPFVTRKIKKSNTAVGMMNGIDSRSIIMYFFGMIVMLLLLL
ncbi:hypothetical protein ABK040_001372 [Willaertia magna]